MLGYLSRKLLVAGFGRCDSGAGQRIRRRGVSAAVRGEEAGDRAEDRADDQAGGEKRDGVHRFHVPGGHVEGLYSAAAVDFVQVGTEMPVTGRRRAASVTAQSVIAKLILCGH